MDVTAELLAMNRLAPIQCTLWGHPDTTGLDTVDYYISSALFEPDEAQKNYTEKLLLMENIVYYQHPTEPLPDVTRADFGFSEDDHLYLCPQSLFKFHPDFDQILGDILQKDSKGILVLVNANYPEWAQILRSRFEKVISDTSSRIRILGSLEYRRFLALLSLGNVMLDTVHFCGGNTSYEAFSVGTPIVTMPSPFMRGRITAGLYQKMQIQDCIAQTQEEYVDIAVRLGTDPVYRESMTSKILAAKHLLYEDMAAVDELAALLMKIYNAG